MPSKVKQNKGNNIGNEESDLQLLQRLFVGRRNAFRRLFGLSWYICPLAAVAHSSRLDGTHEPFVDGGWPADYVSRKDESRSDAEIILHR
jgi:hypothetical protein